MRRLVPVFVSIAVVLAVAVAGGYLLGGRPSPSVLSSEDRAVLGGPDVDRGDPPPVAAHPVPDGAEAVARAYLVAAYAAAPSDAGRTRLDAVRYAEPGSPPAVVGVTVLDPPARGARRVAAVEQIITTAVSDSDPERTRHAFLATVRTTTGAPGAPVRSERLRTRVVVHRQSDGRWLVVAETPDTPDTPALPAGDD